MSQSPHARRWRRAVATLTLTAVGLVVGAGVASAHVTVNPSEAAAGSFSKLTFRVPNESPTAGTVGVTVTLPADHPFAYVSVKAVPGWTVTPTTTTLPSPVTEGDLTIKEAVTSVTWTADAAAMIAPGEFAEFDISAGPVPDVATLEFPAAQTYSDGTVVNWDEPTPASGEEAEHPTPTLTVLPAEGDGHGQSDDPVTSTAAVAVTAQADGTGGSSSVTTVLSLVGVVLGAAALLVAAIALRRRPAPATTAPQGDR